MPEVVGSPVKLKLGTTPPAISKEVKFDVDCPAAVTVVVNV
jgi:hypothetical protein